MVATDKVFKPPKYRLLPGKELRLITQLKSSLQLIRCCHRRVRQKWCCRSNGRWHHACSISRTILTFPLLSVYLIPICTSWRVISTSLHKRQGRRAVTIPLPCLPPYNIGPGSISLRLFCQPRPSPLLHDYLDH